MRYQVNIKRLSATGILLLLVASFMSIYISFLVPKKFKAADWIRTGLMEHIINSLEKFENREQANTVVTLSDWKNNTLSYKDLLPYLKKIQPGTVFFISHGKVVCNLIPGDWTHTGFYLGTKKQMGGKFGEKSAIYKLFHNYYHTGEERLIIDSSFRKGCAVRDFTEMAKLQTQSTLHSMLCLEPKISNEELSLILQSSFAEIGKKYDLNFSVTDTSTVYCAELIYSALKFGGINIDKRTSVLFRDILLPEDMVEEIMEKHMDEFDYKMCLKKNNSKIQDLAGNEIFSLLAGI